MPWIAETPGWWDARNALNPRFFFHVFDKGKEHTRNALDSCPTVLSGLEARPASHGGDGTGPASVVWFSCGSARPQGDEMRMETGGPKTVIIGTAA